MRLSRKQSILASVSILALFFLGVILLRPSSPSLPSASSQNLAPGTPTAEPSEQEDRPTQAAGPDFILDNFKREEVKGGKKIWEVKATRGRYSPSSGRAVLENAEMWLHQKDGGVISLKADKADLRLEGSDGLSAAEFIGNVVIVQDNKTTLKTEQANYDKAKDSVFAPGLVTVVGEKMSLEGIGMEVLISSKDIRLLKQTRTVLESKNEPDTSTQH